MGAGNASNAAAAAENAAADNGIFVVCNPIAAIAPLWLIGIELDCVNTGLGVLEDCCDDTTVRSEEGRAIGFVGVTR